MRWQEPAARLLRSARYSCAASTASTHQDSSGHCQFVLRPSFEVACLVTLMQLT
jgi:hypothetical protein